jgi:serine/threonine protein kinase
MHDKLIVHRDLKLENVLCIGERRVVISEYVQGSYRHTPCFCLYHYFFSQNSSFSFGFAKQLEFGQKLRGLHT